MKITNINDLFFLAEELKTEAAGNAENIKICFTDRFNEYVINADYNIVDTAEGKVVIIPCEKIGSALQGTHRVLGGKNDE